MTNEQLAEFIQQGGNDELAPLLWDKTHDLIYMIMSRYWKLCGETFKRHGLELEDLRQESYNALLFAVKQYDREKPYKFTTYLNYAVKNTIRGLLSNKSDTLNQSGAMSLEQPISEDKDGGVLLLGDTIEDETAVQEYERIDRLDEFKPLHEAVDGLPDTERNVIQMRFFEGLTLKKAAERLGLSYQRVKQIESNALMLLRRGKTGKRLRDIYGDEYAPRRNFAPLIYARHKGLAAFRSSGSSEVEDFVLRRLAQIGY